MSGIIFWGAVAWLFVAGLLALQFWPHVPQSKTGWIAFIAFGPPLYIFAEGLSERFWSSRAGRSLSRPSPAMQTAFVIGSLVIGGAFAWGLWWLQSH
ncbi:hypothetical protein [Nevskia soli]|uniref:hypothetical protein n=1 Tax=Nevskia soli TaxID=418856 RepID=UPI0004A75FB8|nr:hypothetical protein [Nevskia soli]